MARSFAYAKSSIVEIAHHLNTVQLQAYSKLLKYYTDRGDSEMLSKLEQARMLSKVFKAVEVYNGAYDTRIEVSL